MKAAARRRGPFQRFCCCGVGLVAVIWFAQVIQDPETKSSGPQPGVNGELLRWTRRLMQEKSDNQSLDEPRAAIHEFPEDIFTKEQRKNGAVLLHALCAIYMFYALAIVCDDYFVPSLEKISENLQLSEDVAGATFMAAGSSAPELFTSLIAVFITKGDVGVGTIVGSAVFNILVIIGLSGIFAGQTVVLTWWSLFRDSSYYILSVLALIMVIYDDRVFCFVWQSGERGREGGRREAGGRWLGLGPRDKKGEWKSSQDGWVFYNPGILLGAAGFREFTRRFGGLKRGAREKKAGKKGPLMGLKTPPKGFFRGPYKGAQGPRGPQPQSSWGKRVFPLILNPHKLSFSEVVRVFIPPPTFPPRPGSPMAGRGLNRERGQGTGNFRIFPNTSETPGDEGANFRPPPGAVGSQGRGGRCLRVGRGFLTRGSRHSGSGCARVKWLITWPLGLLLYCTVPNCILPRWHRWFMVTFVASTLWIAVFSYLMVWMVTIISFTLDIPDYIMGITFLAAGTSVPDCMASLIVARQGMGDMAVSNSIGSNIFDILLGLGFPWALRTLLVEHGSIVSINNKGLVYSVILLLASVFLTVMSVHLNHWRLDRRLGLGLLFLYAIFLLCSILFGQM
ncbi:hypothetical protein CRENBAI_014892 [Crenichthys baileyi]|uniref:Sodium/calcium exchanger membrane region domain-containing protein n=1 Tax=Crenichthys baileyi TaxID=28760 RepID=A0AAV9S4U8_9TELE